MNRIGLKDYLLNEASDSDLLDCAKAYDTANQYGHFDTYDSVEEAAKLCGWDVETALSESRHVESDADCYRFNGYGHLEAVSNESLLEDARDNIDDIIDWLEGASRYELMDVSSDVELFVDAKDPFEIINEVDCSSHNHGEDRYRRGGVRHIQGLQCVRQWRQHQGGAGGVFQGERAQADCATLANEASECKYIASALEKMGFDVANDRAIEKHAEIEPKQRIVFDRMIGRVGDSYLEVVNQLDNFFDTDRTGQSEFINDNWGNPILVKGGRDGYGDTPCVLAVYEDFVDAMDTSSSDTGGDNIFADCIIDGIWDENGSLILTGALPDGHATICELLGAHACAEMRQLTDKGGRLYLDHLTVDGFHLPKDGIEAMGFVYRDGDESAFLHDLWDNPEMCSRPRFAEKALDMPTEEYIMYHDGVKTEFQITEVKKDSFAYEQGARYDAKVLTNGHDCGNGRFCADLDEAHEFCQQFADSVVGLGESLDDMCEDRRKVASLAQDVDADNRDQEYNNHDNSEIGE